MSVTSLFSRTPAGRNKARFRPLPSLPHTVMTVTPRPRFEHIGGVPQSAAKEAARLYDAAISQQSLDAFLNPGWLPAAGGGAGGNGSHVGVNGGPAPLGQSGSGPVHGSALATDYRSEPLNFLKTPLNCQWWYRVD